MNWMSNSIVMLLAWTPGLALGQSTPGVGSPPRYKAEAMEVAQLPKYCYGQYVDNSLMSTRLYDPAAVWSRDEPFLSGARVLDPCTEVDAPQSRATRVCSQRDKRHPVYAAGYVAGLPDPQRRRRFNAKAKLWLQVSSYQGVNCCRVSRPLGSAAQDSTPA